MFRVSEIINNLSARITDNTILANPFYTALIIIALFLVITYMIAYGEVEVVYDDIDMVTLVAKSAFFGFIGVVSILFLSFNNIENINKRKYKNKNDAKAVNIIESSLEESVKPDKY